MLRTRLSTRCPAEGESILAATRSKADTVGRVLTDWGARQLQLGRPPVEWRRRTTAGASVGNLASRVILSFCWHCMGRRER